MLPTTGILQVSRIKIREECNTSVLTPDRRQSKTLILSTDVDTKSLETELSFESKTLFIVIYDPL